MRAYVRLLLLFACFLPDATAAEPATCPIGASRVTATVVRVIDGDTLLLHDGHEVRLSGVVAPREGDVRATAGRWPATLAARSELEALALANTIIIGVADEHARDRYGRLQGQAFLPRGAGPDLLWLQGHLLRQGLVRVMSTEADRSCAGARFVAEREARDAARGIWREAAYALRAADHVDELASLAGTFQVIDGEVARVRRYGRLVRLDLKASRTHGLQILMPPAKHQAPAVHGSGLSLRPSDLAGARVRARGWLEDRRGRLTLDITLAGDLEVLTIPAERASPVDTRASSSE